MMKRSIVSIMAHRAVLTMYKLDVVTDIESTLAEGPVWFDNTVYWVDITGKRIHRYHPDTDQGHSLQLDEMVGAVVPRTKGGLVAALASGFASVDLTDGSVTRLGDRRFDPRLRFNDGKCDPRGRFWAGMMGLQGERGVASLYMLDAQGNIQTKLTGVSCSNGLAWNSDGTVMYYIDTPTRRVDAFDFDLETGDLSNRRTVVTFGPDDGVPDGMTIDARGNLWIALWGGSSVVCHDPQTGARIDQIPVPASQVTSCTFGGSDLRDMYITTARQGLSDETLAAQPLAGRLFRTRVDVPGTPTIPYSG